MQRGELDSIDVNVLVAALLRRRQDTVGSMIALLDLMLMVAAKYPMREKYTLAGLLRDRADLVERPANQDAPWWDENARS